MTAGDVRPPALGAHVDGAATRFATFTAAASCAVRLYDADGRATATHALEAIGDGYFETRVPGAGHGTLYKFVLDGRELPDPYARFLPRGVHGPAMALESRHAWRAPAVHRPLRELVIYELHVGTFTERGTFRAASARVPELAALGVTAIELMPVAAFAGTHGWGYDGVAPFAPHAPYGTPAELRELVDAAHAHGLSVLLDVVYNHFGPSGNYLATYSPLYCTQAIRTGWGDAPNFEHPAMRWLVLDNARYWLEEFRFDGLRLDAIHAIVDPSPTHILRELADHVADLEPNRLLIGEDERNDSRWITEKGLDALWADDFHHQVRVTLTGEREGYYGAYQPGVSGIADVINRGWLYQGQTSPTTGRPRGTSARALSAERFVYCIQNHDQVGNRATGNRLSDDVSLDAYAAASLLLLFLPMTPLVLMGQEWAASSPFLYFTDHRGELGRLVSEGRRREFQTFAAFSDPAARAAIPDPEEPETFLRSRLRWDERHEGGHARMLDLYRRALALRRTDPVLRHAAREALQATAVGDVLVVRRWRGEQQRVLVVNFGTEAAPLAACGGATLGTHTRVLLESGRRPDAGLIPPAYAAVCAGGEAVASEID